MTENTPTATELTERALQTDLDKFMPSASTYERALASTWFRAGARFTAKPVTVEALRNAANLIDAQRDSSNPDPADGDSWSVIDHKEGRFLGKTVAARIVRAEADRIERQAQR